MPDGTSRQKQHPTGVQMPESLDKERYARSLGVSPEEEPDLLAFISKALEQPLPDPWVQRPDRKGRLYYWNPGSRANSWEHPLLSTHKALVDAYRRIVPLPADDRTAAVQAEIDQFREESEEELKQWRENFDADGTPYYFKVSTHQARWDNPRNELMKHMDLRVLMLGSLAPASKAASSSKSPSKTGRKRLETAAEEKPVVQTDAGSEPAGEASGMSEPEGKANAAPSKMDAEPTVEAEPTTIVVLNREDSSSAESASADEAVSAPSKAPVLTGIARSPARIPVAQQLQANKSMATTGVQVEEEPGSPSSPQEGGIAPSWSYTAQEKAMLPLVSSVLTKVYGSCLVRATMAAEAKQHGEDLAKVLAAQKRAAQAEMQRIQESLAKQVEPSHVQILMHLFRHHLYSVAAEEDADWSSSGGQSRTSLQLEPLLEITRSARGDEEESSSASSSARSAESRKGDYRSASPASTNYFDATSAMLSQHMADMEARGEDLEAILAGLDGFGVSRPETAEVSDPDRGVLGEDVLSKVQEALLAASVDGSLDNAIATVTGAEGSSRPGTATSLAQAREVLMQASEDGSLEKALLFLAAPEEPAEPEAQPVASGQDGQTERRVSQAYSEEGFDAESETNRSQQTTATTFGVPEAVLATTEEDEDPQLFAGLALLPLSEEDEELLDGLVAKDEAGELELGEPVETPELDEMWDNLRQAPPTVVETRALAGVSEVQAAPSEEALDFEAVRQALFAASEDGALDTAISAVVGQEALPEEEAFDFEAVRQALLAASQDGALDSAISAVIVPEDAASTEALDFAALRQALLEASEDGVLDEAILAVKSGPGDVPLSEAVDMEAVRKALLGASEDGALDSAIIAAKSEPASPKLRPPQEALDLDAVREALLAASEDGALDSAIASLKPTPVELKAGELAGLKRDCLQALVAACDDGSLHKAMEDVRAVEPAESEGILDSCFEALLQASEDGTLARAMSEVKAADGAEEEDVLDDWRQALLAASEDGSLDRAMSEVKEATGPNAAVDMQMRVMSAKDAAHGAVRRAVSNAIDKQSTAEANLAVRISVYTEVRRMQEEKDSFLPQMPAVEWAQMHLKAETPRCGTPEVLATPRPLSRYRRTARPPTDQQQFWSTTGSLMGAVVKQFVREVCWRSFLKVMDAEATASVTEAVPSTLAVTALPQSTVPVGAPDSEDGRSGLLLRLPEVLAQAGRGGDLEAALAPTFFLETVEEEADEGAVMEALLAATEDGSLEAALEQTRSLPSEPVLADKPSSSQGGVRSMASRAEPSKASSLTPTALAAWTPRTPRELQEKCSVGRAHADGFTEALKASAAQFDSFLVAGKAPQPQALQSQSPAQEDSAPEALQGRRRLVKPVLDLKSRPVDTDEVHDLIVDGCGARPPTPEEGLPVGLPEHLAELLERRIEPTLRDRCFRPTSADGRAPASGMPRFQVKSRPDSAGPRVRAARRIDIPASTTPATLNSERDTEVAASSIRRFLSKKCQSVQAAVTQLDSTGRGVISKKDWVEGLARLDYQSDFGHEEVFDILDTKGHGVLTLSDLMVDRRGAPIQDGIEESEPQQVAGSIITEVMNEQLGKVVSSALSEFLAAAMVQAIESPGLVLPEVPAQPASRKSSGAKSHASAVPSRMASRTSSQLQNASKPSSRKASTAVAAAEEEREVPATAVPQAEGQKATTNNRLWAPQQEAEEEEAMERMGSKGDIGRVPSLRGRLPTKEEAAPAAEAKAQAAQPAGSQLPEVPEQPASGKESRASIGSNMASRVQSSRKPSSSSQRPPLPPQETAQAASDHQSGRDRQSEVGQDAASGAVHAEEPEQRQGSKVPEVFVSAEALVWQAAAAAGGAPPEAQDTESSQADDERIMGAAKSMEIAAEERRWSKQTLTRLCSKQIRMPSKDAMNQMEMSTMVRMASKNSQQNESKAPSRQPSEGGSQGSQRSSIHHGGLAEHELMIEPSPVEEGPIETVAPLDTHDDHHTEAEDDKHHRHHKDDSGSKTHKKKGHHHHHHHHHRHHHKRKTEGSKPGSREKEGKKHRSHTHGETDEEDRPHTAPEAADAEGEADPVDVVADEGQVDAEPVEPEQAQADVERPTATIAPTQNDRASFLPGMSGSEWPYGPGPTSERPDSRNTKTRLPPARSATQAGDKSAIALLPNEGKVSSVLGGVHSPADTPQAGKDGRGQRRLQAANPATTPAAPPRVNQAQPPKDVSRNIEQEKFAAELSQATLRASLSSVRGSVEPSRRFPAKQPSWSRSPLIPGEGIPLEVVTGIKPPAHMMKAWAPRPIGEVCKTYGHVFRMFKDPTISKLKPPVKRPLRISVSVPQMPLYHDGDVDPDEADPNFQHYSWAQAQSTPDLHSSVDSGGSESRGGGGVVLPPVHRNSMSGKSGFGESRHPMDDAEGAPLGVRASEGILAG